MLPRPTALRTLQKEWSTHQASHTFSILEYKQYALHLAFTNQTEKLFARLLSPPSTPLSPAAPSARPSPTQTEPVQTNPAPKKQGQATSSSKPSSKTANTKAAKAKAAKTTKSKQANAKRAKLRRKSQPMPEPNPLSRRKSMRLANKEGLLEDKIASSYASAKKEASGLKGILKKSDSASKGAQVSFETFEKNDIGEGDVRQVQSSGEGFTTIDSLTESFSNELKLSVSSKAKPAGNTFRRRKSIIVDSDGSPMPEFFSSPAPAIKVFLSSSIDEATPTTLSGTHEEDKENNTPATTKATAVRKPRKSLLGRVFGRG